MAAADGLVAILQQIRSDHIHDEGNNPENSERPGESQPWDHGSRRKGIHQSAYPGSSSGDAVCNASPTQKPLRCNSHGPDEEKPHAKAEAYALAQEDVPFLVSKRSTDHGEGLEEDSKIEDESGAEEANEIGG